MATALAPPGAVERIGQRVLRLRKLRGWSQNDLAALAGLTQHDISQIEIGARDKGRMELTTAMRLALALGVSVDALAGMPYIPGAHYDYETGILYGQETT